MNKINSIKYLCEKCTNSSPLTKEEKDFLLLFLNESQIANYKIHDDIFQNEKSDYLVNQVYKKAFSDKDIYDKTWNAYYKIQDSNYLCEKCGETVHNTFSNHSYDIYKMYKKIEVLEAEDLINQIASKSHIDNEALREITSCEDFSQIWLLEECLKQIDLPLYNKFVTADKSLQWFNWNEKGGGESYSELIEYIRVFIISIVIPGIIWDITKIGVIRFYQFVRKFLVNKKYTNSINNELLKNEEELKLYAKNLSKKEIKKIVKKEVRKQIKDITKICKHKTKRK